MAIRREEAIRVLREQADQIRSFGVISLGLFGSIVRGDFSTESDIDILVEFDPAARGAGYFDRYFGLHECLEKLLSSRVDLVTAQAVKPRVRPYIDRDLVNVLKAA